MSDAGRLLLDRALAAEDRVDELTERLADARSRIKGALGADPSSAVQALGWLTRCENAEQLLAEMVEYLDTHPTTARDLPDGWEPRARAQVKAANLAAREEREIGFDRPDDHDFWTRHETDNGTRQVLTEHRARNG